MFFSIISLMFAALCSREKQGTLSCGVYVYLYVCRLYMRPQCLTGRSTLISLMLLLFGAFKMCFAYLAFVDALLCCMRMWILLCCIRMSPGQRLRRL